MHHLVNGSLNPSKPSVSFHALVHVVQVDKEVAECRAVRAKLVLSLRTLGGIGKSAFVSHVFGLNYHEHIGIRADREVLLGNRGFAIAEVALVIGVDLKRRGKSVNL